MVGISIGTISTLCTPPPARGVNRGAVSRHRNYDQTVTDRAKHCINRYWEVIGRLSIGSSFGRLTLMLGAPIWGFHRDYQRLRCDQIAFQVIGQFEGDHVSYSL